MKNIVVFDDYNEKDLKPAGLLQEYIALTGEDVRNWFGQKNGRAAVPCPACLSSEAEKTFDRFGLSYQRCRQCGSLFVSPRPCDEAICDYYVKAPARRFWQEKIQKETAPKRRDKIVQPRYEWVRETTREILPGARHWVDINTNQRGYITAMSTPDFFEKKTLLNPFIPLEKGELKDGSTVIDQHWYRCPLAGQADVVTIFEVADHVADIEALFSAVTRMLTPGGLCFMTGILASGFDLLVLGEFAGNVYPPDRLNVFTVQGLYDIFQRHQLECLELSTPGILDVELVLKACEENPGLSLPPFIEYLLYKKDEQVRRSFQEFLQMNLMSSYGRIVLRKET